MCSQLVQMDKKPDIRGYVNPFVPGGLCESSQKEAMSPGVEVYTETKTGEIINKFILSIRSGSIVEVTELYYLAPGSGYASKRRAILAERVTEIKKRKGVIRETNTGNQSDKGKLPGMLMYAYEQIATSGRARKRLKEGRPPKWPTNGPTYDGYNAIWCSRKFSNDEDRVEAIKEKFGKSPGASWLRWKFGSPHKVTV